MQGLFKSANSQKRVEENSVLVGNQLGQLLQARIQGGLLTCEETNNAKQGTMNLPLGTNNNSTERAPIDIMYYKLPGICGPIVYGANT